MSSTFSLQDLCCLTNIATRLYTNSTNETLSSLLKVNHFFRQQSFQEAKQRESRKIDSLFTYFLTLVQHFQSENQIDKIKALKEKTHIAVIQTETLISLQKATIEGCQKILEILNVPEQAEVMFRHNQGNKKLPFPFDPPADWIKLNAAVKLPSALSDTIQRQIQVLIPMLTKPVLHPLHHCWLEHICSGTFIPFEPDLIHLITSSLQQDKPLQAEKLASLHFTHYQNSRYASSVVEQFLVHNHIQLIATIVKNHAQKEKRQLLQYAYEYLLNYKETPIETIFALVEEHECEDLDYVLESLLHKDIATLEKGIPWIKKILDPQIQIKMIFDYSIALLDHQRIPQWIQILQTVDIAYLTKEEFLDTPRLEDAAQTVYENISELARSTTLTKKQHQEIQKLYIQWTRTRDDRTASLITDLHSLPQEEQLDFLTLWKNQIFEQQTIDIHKICEELTLMFSSVSLDAESRANLHSEAIEQISLHLLKETYDNFEKRTLLSHLLLFAKQTHFAPSSKQQEQTLNTLFLHIRKWLTAPHDWKWYFIEEMPSLLHQLACFAEDSIPLPIKEEIKQHIAIIRLCSCLDLYRNSFITVPPLNQNLEQTQNIITQVASELSTFRSNSPRLAVTQYIQQTEQALHYLQHVHEQIEILERRLPFETDEENRAFQNFIEEEKERISHFEENELKKILLETITTYEPDIETSARPHTYSSEYSQKIREKLSPYATAVQLRLPYIFQFEKIETFDALLFELVYHHDFLILPVDIHVEKAYEQFRTAYNTRAKVLLRTQARACGLKLPTIILDSVFEEQILSKELFLEHIAYQNNLAIPKLVQNDDPLLLQFSKNYNAIVIPLKKAWEYEVSHIAPTAIQMIKEGERPVIKTIFCDRSQGKLLGTGSSKIASEALVYSTAIEKCAFGKRPVLTKTKNKCLLTNKIQNSSHNRELRSEYIIARSLREAGVPNILKMSLVTYNNPTSQGMKVQYGILTDICEGGNLHTYLKTHALPFPDRKRLALELCDTISHMHGVHYVHSDLKTHNIYISLDANQKPHIQLGDFGNAQREGIRSGFTSTFLAPEHYQDALDQKGILSRCESDNYCLGEILLYLFLGRTEFDRRELSYAELMQKHWIKDHHEHPTADMAHEAAVKATYTTLHIYWSKKASCSTDPEHQLAALFTGLFDPNPTTRMTAEQAKNFIMLL